MTTLIHVIVWCVIVVGFLVGIVGAVDKGTTRKLPKQPKVPPAKTRGRYTRMPSGRVLTAEELNEMEEFFNEDGK